MVSIKQNNDVTLVSWRLKSPTTRLFVQQHSWQKRNFVTLHYCPFVRGNPTVTGGFPSQKARNSESVPMSVMTWYCKVVVVFFFFFFGRFWLHNYWLKYITGSFCASKSRGNSQLSKVVKQQGYGNMIESMHIAAMAYSLERNEHFLLKRHMSVRYL